MGKLFYASVCTRSIKALAAGDKLSDIFAGHVIASLPKFPTKLRTLSWQSGIAR